MSWNTEERGRLSTLDLLIKVNCFDENVNNLTQALSVDTISLVMALYAREC
jgi:hypothetical protein